MQEPKQDKNATTKTDRQQTAVKSVSRNGQGIAASPLDPLVQQVSRMGNAPNPSAHAAILNRAPANQQSSNRQLLLQLQQQYGNPYVNQVLQLARGMGGQTAANTTEKPLMQAKLTIGSVGDKYEQEADRTAQLVVQRMNAPSQPDRSQVIGREAMPEAELQKKPEISTIQRQEMPKEKEEEQQAEVKQETDSLQLQKKCGGCEKKEEDNLAQMKPETGTFPQEELPKDEEKEELTMQLLAEHQPAEGGMAATPKLETSIQQKRGKGQPLSDKLREPMEQAFGKDFSGVRVHADAQSDQINRSIQARAFTTGQDIFFRQGEYASGSKQGQELLAHELTHVVQQNGSAIKAKTEQGVTLSELSPDARVQRLCSNCEKEEKPENTLQAKEVSSGTLAVAPEPEVSISQVTQPAIQRVFDDLPDRREPKAPKQEKEKQPEAPEETAESDTSDCDQQGDANKPQPEAQQEEQQPEKCPSEKEDKGKKQPKPEKTKPLKDKLSEKPASCVRQEQNPILQAFAPIPTATPNLTARSAITTATNTSTPQQNLQATGETASPETATEKVQATTTATEAQGQLRTTDAEVARLASSKINFKLPKQEETDTDNNSAALEEQRAAASSMASNFFAEAALRIQTVTGLGQSISARINGVAENAKASVMSTVQQQQDAVAAQINQQRTQVNSQAQRSIAEIQQQYQATLRNISLRTAEVSQRIQTEYSNAFQKVDQGETNLLSRVDQLYIQTYDQYIAAGDTVGNEATAVGEKWVKQWESEITDKYSNEDAVVEDRGHMRSTRPNAGKTVEVAKNSKIWKKASTATEVAKQYKEQVTEEATKQANNLVKGKAKDIKGICCAIKEFRKQLQKQQEETLKAVIDLQQDAVLQVTEAQTKLTESANQTLQATLQSLDEQETAQLQILQGYGDRQVLAIERDAQKAIASLQKGVNQAANKLLTALQDYYSEFQGMEAPNPDELSVTLAEILGQFDNSIATVQKETEKGIAVSEDGIAQGEQQAVSAVGAIAQTVMEESAAVVEEAKTSFNNLDRGITNTFNQVRDAYTQAANKFVEDTAKGLAQITQNSQNPLEQIYQKLSEALQKSVTQIETGLRDTLKCLETDIQNYAAKAVEDEPWWKSLLKALVFIVVIVVAIVLAPIGIGFVAGALGGGIAATIFASVVVGAALGAGLGALSQIANNAIDGKNLMDGVGKAALAGAIGGAVGGFGGVLGGVLGNVGKLGVGLSKTWSKFGIETVFDTLGNIFGDLAAGNPITLEGVLIGAAIGAGTYVATTKGTLRRLGKPGEKIQSFQERSSEAGMRGGAFVGGKVKSAFGGKVDTSVDSRSGVDGRSAKPSETEVKAPKTSVPGGRGVDSPTVSRPDVDISTPSTRPDVGTETLRSLKFDTDVPMTVKEREILQNTAPKRGNELTQEELNTELEVAGKAERKPINEAGFVEEIDLPNNHEWKKKEDGEEKKDGTWCRFSDGEYCKPGAKPGDKAADDEDKMDVDSETKPISNPQEKDDNGYEAETEFLPDKSKDGVERFKRTNKRNKTRIAVLKDKRYLSEDQQKYNYVELPTKGNKPIEINVGKLLRGNFMKGNGDQPKWGFDKKDYGEEYMGTNYDLIVKTINENQGEFTEKQIAEHILNYIYKGNDQIMMNKQKYNNKMRLAVSMLIQLTHFIEPHITRHPGSDKYARASLKRIADEKSNFKEEFNRNSGNYLPARANPKKEKSKSGGQQAMRGLQKIPEENNLKTKEQKRKIDKVKKDLINQNPKQKKAIIVIFKKLEKEIEKGKIQKTTEAFEYLNLMLQTRNFKEQSPNFKFTSINESQIKNVKKTLDYMSESSDEESIPTASSEKEIPQDDAKEVYKDKDTSMDEDSKQATQEQIVDSSNQFNQSEPNNIEELRREMKQLQQNHTRGDGNCFFHAIFETVNEKRSELENQQSIRDELLDQILERNYAQNDEEANAMIDRLQSGEWAGEEDVTSTAEVFNLEIVIWNQDRSFHQIVSPNVSPNNSNPQIPRRIHLIYSNQNHYDSLTHNYLN
ncbi:MAG: DUF4157 domain-containing protein [Nostoc sp.]|uniref:eCIS core domain-containing protein n=1 Tax=Nostoc sp. TaxID=1180 RepID=UPI002FF9453D